MPGEPYEFMREMLHEQTEVNMSGKRKWDGPVLELISYKNSTLRFKVSLYCEAGFTVDIHVGPDKLGVSFNCGMQVEKFCILALKTLERLINHDGCRYFEKYKPVG